MNFTPILSEKTLTVVLKDLIRLPLTRISENIKCQDLNPTHCVEIPTHTKYSIYRIMFAPGTTLAQVNHIRFIENIKIYWEKYESQTNDSMFPLPDARSHIVKLQQKTNMCQMRRTT